MPIAAVRVLLVSMLILLAVTACAPEERSAGPAPPVSLVTAWSDVRIDDPVPTPELAPLAEIRFADDAAKGSGEEGVSGAPPVIWRALQGIDDLRLEGGRLAGKTTSDEPVLLLELATPVGIDDELWAVEIRLVASVGKRVAVHPLSPSGPPLGATLGRIDAWPLSSPLIPGDEPRRYAIELDRVFTLEMPVGTSAIEQVLVRPTDTAGAEIAIESVRLLFRRERLAAIDSGPGWHGLGEVFREALVSRTPEILSFAVELPERPWLDLALGTVEESPTTFRVEVVTRGKAPEAAAAITVEEPEQWRPARVDLTKWAGQQVELRLSGETAEPGGLAFWGAPTIRDSVPEGFIGDHPRTVILFLADTLRADHLDAWGYGRETAPTLSRLATEGSRFAHVVAQGTWTKVSVPSLLTSRYPASLGIAGLNDRIAAAETTLAEVFRDAGYATFATSSVPFSGQLTNLHQGVEVLHEFAANSIRDDSEYSSKTAAGWVDAYLSWLEQHPDVPTFALIHAMDPHSPFEPEPPWNTAWIEDGGAERFAAQSDRVRPHIESPLLRRFMAPSRAELAAAEVDEGSFVAHEKAWYDGSIRGMDDQLDRLIERVEGLGLGEVTLLAFAADHGEEFLEHDHHWHGRTVYGEVSRVPLVLWGRGVPAGRVVERTVQNLDLMPTLLELADLPIPDGAQGRSLVPLLSDGAATVRDLPAFTEVRSDDPQRSTSFAIVEAGYKLVWNAEPGPEMREYELYDAAADPLNQDDIAAAHPEIVAELGEKVRAWRTWAEGQQRDDAEAASDLSADELERLRSLGYIE